MIENQTKECASCILDFWKVWAVRMQMVVTGHEARLLRGI
jgi:hypothetical protein